MNYIFNAYNSTGLPCVNLDCELADNSQFEEIFYFSRF
jgi:hypothetical protein